MTLVSLKTEKSTLFCHVTVLAHKRTFPVLGVRWQYYGMPLWMKWNVLITGLLVRSPHTLLKVESSQPVNKILKEEDVLTNGMKILQSAAKSWMDQSLPSSSELASAGLVSGAQEANSLLSQVDEQRPNSQLCWDFGLNPIAKKMVTPPNITNPYPGHYFFEVQSWRVTWKFFEILG